MNHNNLEQFPISNLQCCFPCLREGLGSKPLSSKWGRDLFYGQNKEQALCYPPKAFINNFLSYKLHFLT